MTSLSWQQSSSPSHFQTPPRKLKLSSVTNFSSPPTSPTFSSPLSAVHERRRSQYKSTSPSVAGSSSATRPAFKRKPSVLFTHQSDKERARQRFQDKCFERAAKARKTAVTRKRHLNSSPGDDFMDDDGEELDEDIMGDELYRRVVTSGNSKTRHAYLVSFEREVGSPIDPAVEDIDEWERELHESSSPCPEMTPEDREIAELEAYAAECERQAEEFEFEDIPPEFLDDNSPVDGANNDASMDTS